MKSGVLNLAEILTSRKSDPYSYIQLCKKNGGGGPSPHPCSDACDLLIERCKYKHAGNEGSDCCRKKSQKRVVFFSAMPPPTYPTWIAKVIILLLKWTQKRNLPFLLYISNPNLHTYPNLHMYKIQTPDHPSYFYTGKTTTQYKSI